MDRLGRVEVCFRVQGSRFTVLCGVCSRVQGSGLCALSIKVELSPFQSFPLVHMHACICNCCAAASAPYWPLSSPWLDPLPCLQGFIKPAVLLSASKSGIHRDGPHGGSKTLLYNIGAY